MFTHHSFPSRDVFTFNETHLTSRSRLASREVDAFTGRREGGDQQGRTPFIRSILQRDAFR